MAISNPQLWPNYFCYQGDYHEIPETAASDSGLFSFAEGFPPITATPLKAGGVAPNREDFNGLLRLISENIFFLQQGGFYLYDATVTYKQNAVVMYDGSLYQSLADNNKGHQPDTSSTQWKPFIPNDEVASYLTSLTLLSRICDKINASNNTPSSTITPAQVNTALTAILSSISAMGKVGEANTWAKKQTLTLGAAGGSNYTPTDNADLTTKKYVDDALDEVTGNIAFKDETNTFTKDQIFDANLQFTNRLIYSYITKLGLVPKGELAEENKYLQLRLLDSENLNQIAHTLAEMAMAVNTDGDTSSFIRAYKNETGSSESADILVGYDKSRNRFYTKCLSPDASSDTTEIATTEWCHDNLVDTTSTQHINANKYFNNLGLQTGIFRCDSNTAIKGTENTADSFKIAFVQKDGMWNYSSTIGGFEVNYSNDKSVKTRIYASSGVNENDNRNSEISINYDAAGNPFTYAPNPRTNPSDNEIVNVGYLRDRILEAMPSGTIVAYAGRTVPNGWLWCNGSNVSRTTYAALFAAIGTNFGTGDGSTTFTLPDGRNRTLWGANATSNVGSYLSAGLPNIYGQFNDAHAGTYGSASGVLGWQQSGNISLPGDTEQKWQYGNLILNVGFANSLFGSSATVQPNALQGLMIIKI